MTVVPLTLAQANALITAWHRHHRPARGHRFSIGAVNAMNLVGGAVVGRPAVPAWWLCLARAGPQRVRIYPHGGLVLSRIALVFSYFNFTISYFVLDSDHFVLYT
jgi:hypothetical protein